MFFIVSHHWTAPQEDAASKRIIRLMLVHSHPDPRKPWPKLLSLWQNPRKREVIACWESPTRRQLTQVFAGDHPVLRTEIKHVRQLFPPHAQGYNVMKIKTDPNWGPGLK
jgi:hypothetical protein